MESHLQALITFFSAHPTIALAAVFAAALLEALAVIGTVVPGSSIVFVGGMLVGLKALDPAWAAVAAVSGAILGDGISYWLGRHHRERIRSMWPLKNHPAILERGQAYFKENGGKSVFLGRFLGPVRAIVPLVAGMSDMPIVRFYTVNVLSALAWAAAHMLPGVLFGASLQLAGAVSSRLVILLAALVAGTWALAWLVRLLHRHAWPLIKRRRDHLVGWAQGKPGVLARVVLSFLDPSRPESLGLLVAAGLLLGGAWIFFGVLQDVVANDPLVRFDQTVFDVLQHVRTTWADDVMVTITELASGAVAAAVVAAVALLLAIKRSWRTLTYWLTAIGFAQILVWVLKTALSRTRPTDLYSGFERFSFPSGHTTSSVVLYGFLAFLIARGRSFKARVAVTLIAALAMLLVSFSRLYLGAHWLSDVLASLSLGTAWVALLSIAYTQHGRNERLPAQWMALAAGGTLVVAGALYVSANHEEDIARYAPRRTAGDAVLPDWQGDGWQRLPARRTEIDGDLEEPLSLQWAGSSDQIVAALSKAGWQAPSAWTSRAALLWLLPSTLIDKLPVLPKFHHGQPQQLSFEKMLDDNRRVVLRLWQTQYLVEGTGPRNSLWNGMVTVERLEHPVGLITLASSDGDVTAATRLLAESVTGRQVSRKVRAREGLPVLLIR